MNLTSHLKMNTNMKGNLSAWSSMITIQRTCSYRCYKLCIHSDTDCTSSDDVDELDASYLDDITLSPSTHHASSHDIVDVTTSPVGSEEVLDDQLTVEDMIIPMVRVFVREDACKLLIVSF